MLIFLAFNLRTTCYLTKFMCFVFNCTQFWSFKYFVNDWAARYSEDVNSSKCEVIAQYLIQIVQYLVSNSTTVKNAYLIILGIFFHIIWSNLICLKRIAKIIYADLLRLIFLFLHAINFVRRGNLVCIGIKNYLKFSTILLYSYQLKYTFFMWCSKPNK